jgi:asparaginyl-tRNA synthetase
MSSPVSTISDIGKHEGQTVTIRGWLYNLRESGKLLFPQFRDGSGLIQGVVPKNPGVERDRRGKSPRRQARARRV